jgi:hypothetical protein
VMSPWPQHGLWEDNGQSLRSVNTMMNEFSQR